MLRDIVCSDSVIMVPEEQFGFKTADVTSGVQHLLLHSVRLVRCMFLEKFLLVM